MTMTIAAIEVRLRQLETEIGRIRDDARIDAEFKADVRAFIAEQSAYGRERAEDAKEIKERLVKAEGAIRILENFKAKLIGAVVMAGLSGGGLGALGQLLVQTLGQ